MNTNIEKSLLASVLNSANSEIDIKLDKNFFTVAFHKKLIAGINRLRELNKPIDFELLRNSFIKANKWSLNEDNALIDIMTSTTPFGSNNLFNQYYKHLENTYFENFDMRLAVWISI